jgi:hypothetical protein
MKRGCAKRPLQVAAREQAVAEAIAKAEHAQVDANRLRDDLQGKNDYLQTCVREIA